MTDFWPEESENIWRMTDDAWASYQRFLMQNGWGDEPDCPSAGYSGSGRGVPVGEPTVDRERGSESLPAPLAELDFTAGCEKCGEPAAWYTEIHWPHHCAHPSMDAGRLCQMVCPEHLKAYERRADKMVAEAHPPRWVGWFRKVHPNCRSCGKPIQTPGDIIRVVRAV